MSFKVNMPSLCELQEGVVYQGNKWIKELGDLKGCISTIITSSDIEGSTADSIKLYLLLVHMQLINSLERIIYFHINACTSYYVDYRDNVDDSWDAIIYEEELDRIWNQMDACDRKMSEVGCSWANDNCVPSILDRVSDICVVNKPDIVPVNMSSNFAKRYIKELKRKINIVEDNHTNNDFNESSCSIESINKLIYYLSGQFRGKVSCFIASELLETEEFKDMFYSSLSLAQKIERDSDNFSKNLSRLEEILNNDIEIRNEETEWVKGALSLLATVEALSSKCKNNVVGASITIAASGAKTFLSKARDQYVNNPYNMDYTSIGKDVAVDIAATFTSECFGSFGECFIGSFYKSKCVIDDSNGSMFLELSKGFSERFTESFLSDVSEGKNVVSAFNDALNSALDSDEVGKDFFAGFLNGNFDGLGDAWAGSNEINDINND